MAAYLLNLLPSTAINNEILYTRLFHKKPDYSRLRIFGCLCYPHLHSPHKLAPRATPCIFLGFPAYHRGFRCLDLETNKIILSRHVTFDETQFPYRSMTPNAPPTYTFLDPAPSPLLNHGVFPPPQTPNETPTPLSTENTPDHHTSPHAASPVHQTQQPPINTHSSQPTIDQPSPITETQTTAHQHLNPLGFTNPSSPVYHTQQ